MGRYARKNIIYGINPSDEEFKRAARTALVEEFAGSFEKGYETLLGENACRISEGQKQKIAIARALARGPRLLILDEAMSSMDSESEKRILEGIKENYSGVTAVVISHRLSALRYCENVCFVKSKTCVETGTLADFAGKSGEFDALFSGQGAART